jgi:segregation and condensation protein A
MSDHLDEGTYRIHLPQFEGPFDLLLFFIERDELDIYDIPISQITDDFLEYIHTMQQLNFDLASEFILVASTLMRIKAKMLLPRPVINEAGEEVDPREELVQRLLEYKRYKSVLAELEQMELAQFERIVRGYAKKEEKSIMNASSFPEEELIGMDLYTIMCTFKRIWERYNDQITEPKHVIRKYPYNVESIKTALLSRLESHEQIDFVSFVMEQKDRVFVVFSFLAILEMTQVQKLSIVLGEGYNNFWLRKKQTAS